MRTNCHLAARENQFLSRLVLASCVELSLSLCVRLIKRAQFTVKNMATELQARLAQLEHSLRLAKYEHSPLSQALADRFQSYSALCRSSLSRYTLVCSVPSISTFDRIGSDLIGRIEWSLNWIGKAGQIGAIDANSIQPRIQFHHWRSFSLCNFAEKGTFSIREKLSANGEPRVNESLQRAVGAKARAILGFNLIYQLTHLNKGWLQRGSWLDNRTDDFERLAFQSFRGILLAGSRSQCAPFFRFGPERGLFRPANRRRFWLRTRANWLPNELIKAESPSSSSSSSSVSWASH